MNGKPYHKMPDSSWMTPGGNREQKRRLINEKRYPMKSAIQKNLGGPLSDVFFANLTPIQQDHVGYTPKLAGPGPDLWMAPSDYLMGKVVLKPPTRTRIKQALMHKGILELGADIEEKVIRAHEIEMEAAIRKKEQEIMKLADQLVSQAVIADRKAQAVVTNNMLQEAQQHLATIYQDTLMCTVDEIMVDAAMRMEQAVQHTRHQMEMELCGAVESHAHYLGRQYELQVHWLHNQLFEKYENTLKKQAQKFSEEMDNIMTECEFNLARNSAQIQAEHMTDLVVQASEKSKKHHEEKKNLEHNFGAWFINNFETEIINRDFTILELEDTVRHLEAQNQRREENLRDIFKHFQKFINYALHETPGQAEFLLSLEKELKAMRKEGKSENEGEHIAKTIIEFILKCVAEKEEERKEARKKMDEENFRVAISEERSQNRILALVGETSSKLTLQDHSRSPTKDEAFKTIRLESLINLFKRNPSAMKLINSLHEIQLKDLISHWSLEPETSSAVGACSQRPHQPSELGAEDLPD